MAHQAVVSLPGPVAGFLYLPARLAPEVEGMERQLDQEEAAGNYLLTEGLEVVHTAANDAM
eukprot:4004704-Ditylum_brightwellii.AAC.1